MWRDSDPDPETGAPVPPLQPVEIPAVNTMEGGGKGDGLDSGQMTQRAGLGAVPISESDQEAFDFLVATEVGKFTPR